MTDTDVLAPVEQEGTQAVVRSWLKKIGENVAEGDPLVELETDKVAVEVPAPASGVLKEIVVSEDGAAEPGAVLGRIGEGAMSAAPKPDTEEPKQETHKPKTNGAAKVAAAAVADKENRLSPSVRRLVLENDLDPAQIDGTGKDGRLTRADVETYLKDDGRKQQRKTPTLARAPSSGTGRSEKIPHDRMRRRIAEHMSHSVATAPHVTAVFEADFSAIMAHRAKNKEDYARRGVNLTYTAYMLVASVEAMRVSPTVNSQWHDDCLEVFEDVNIGVGTALGDKGLIVPVVQQAQRRSLFDIAGELQRLTEKARNGALAPEDVRGGTFSISNHGTSGSLVASPIIINQPQSAILGVGKLEKRVIVKTVDGVDSMQIRPMCYVTLTIDHRVLDGSQTNAWLSRFVEVLENWPQ
ncbi:2-oxo acid dehydrogenase subunit E2 [Hyphococcus flavus]|uniref:Dihydrolipoamide acetyltransferase component of pyruvate dehydrogenase complex n=1 Tax=Hyphococcus flavus TaxID=1866326 RepID=A0AAF0CEW9_9PROT|nr:2-oxo acid dehydrogenase subunit E2 [Hyphococcus flavus]WDI30178.1 2-oxo acid dehydrogenase subunit E2 [Hyphococcus flavus]